MMENLNLWWKGRAPRERVLLLIMTALMIIVIGWLGVYRPLENGLRSAAISNMEAAERYADVARKVGWLKEAGQGSTAQAALPVEQVVGQSAGEVGFTLDRVQAQGDGRVDIAIASARASALLGWIATLEAQGVAVEKALITPSGAAGTVSAQVTFRRSGASQ